MASMKEFKEVAKIYLSLCPECKLKLINLGVKAKDLEDAEE